MNKSESFDYDDESDDDEENELDLAGYNAEEIKRYRELLIELEKKNVPTLKSILKNNDYYFFGNKDDLISLVADGMVKNNLNKKKLIDFRIDSLLPLMQKWKIKIQY